MGILYFIFIDSFWYFYRSINRDIFKSFKCQKNTYLSPVFQGWLALAHYFIFLQGQADLWVWDPWGTRPWLGEATWTKLQCGTRPPLPGIQSKKDIVAICLMKPFEYWNQLIMYLLSQSFWFVCLFVFGMTIYCVPNTILYCLLAPLASHTTI